MDNPDYSVLEQFIITSFEHAKPHRLSSGGVLSHEEAVSFRDELWSLTHEDFSYYLPQIMIDLLCFHDKPFDFENVDRLFEHLNVAPPSDYSNMAFAQNEISKVTQDEEQLKHAKVNMYRLFTSEQSKAITDWLQYVRVWFASRDYSLREIDNALKYWRQRASVNVPRE